MSNPNVKQSKKQVIDEDAIRADAEKLLNSNKQTDTFEDENFQNLFKIQTANCWLADAKKRPVPKQLFDEFWFEGELCILFADTNVGKSILAVQIGNALSNGQSIENLRIEAEKQIVLYCDFELSDKQFESRYSRKGENDKFFSRHYQFSDNFIRAEINPNANVEHGFASFEDYLNNSLNYSIAETGAKILIIDNLTYLKNETEKAKDALPLMKHLKALKSRFDLSILALAHTPKRDYTKELGRNDLQGSKMLINFCDSSFAIGESSKEKGLRYLKQIKVRNTEIKFDADNVQLCQIQKPDNFLHFAFEGSGRESEHLKTFTEKDREQLIKKAKELHEKGESMQAIGDKLGVSKMTVSRYVNK